MQDFFQRVSHGDCQALARHLLQARGGVGLLASQQDIGVFQVGTTETELGLPLGAGHDSADDVGLARGDPLYHRVDLANALDFEAQARPQANQFQQVGGDAAKIAVGIEERQRREGLIDHDFDDRVLFQPAFFTLGQLQFFVGQQDIAAGAPALGDAVSLIHGNGRQYRIDDAEQNLLVLAQRKTETIGFMFAEIRHADVLQIALVDHVMGGDGVPQKHIRLIKGHCIQGVLIRGEGADIRLRVQLFHFAQRQVVVDEAQAQPGQAIAQTARFLFAGHQYRLIYCVRLRQDEIRVGGLKAVGGTQQVNFTFFQGANRGFPRGVAQYLDRQGHGFGQEPGVIGGQAFIVAAAGGQVEGWVIGCRGAQHQLAFVQQPLALSLVQLSIQLNGTRAAQ